MEAIEVCGWLITNTPDLRVELAGTAVPCSTGLQLGSLYPDPESQVFDYLPENMLVQVTNAAEFPRCLILDKWTCNSDGRQAIFVRKPRSRKYNASFIESGKRASLLALSPLRTGRESFPSSGSSHV